MLGLQEYRNISTPWGPHHQRAAILKHSEFSDPLKYQGQGQYALRYTSPRPEVLLGAGAGYGETAGLKIRYDMTDISLTVRNINDTPFFSDS